MGCNENKDCKDGKECLNRDSTDNVRFIGVCAKPCVNLNKQCEGKEIGKKCVKGRVH